MTLSLICSSNGFVCSESSPVSSSSSSLDDVSCEPPSSALPSSSSVQMGQDDSLFSSLLLSLSPFEDESSSLLSNNSGAGVIEVVSSDPDALEVSSPLLYCYCYHRLTVIHHHDYQKILEAGVVGEEDF